MSKVDLLQTDLTKVSTATILCWRQPTCRLEIFGSGGCRGGNGGSKGVRDSNSGAASVETEGVSAWGYVGGSQWNQRGSGDGGKKSGGGGGGGGKRNMGSASQTLIWNGFNWK